MSIVTSAGVTLFLLLCTRISKSWNWQSPLFGLLLPLLSWGFRFFRTLTLGYNPFCWNTGVKCWSSVKRHRDSWGWGVGRARKGEQEEENKEHGIQKIRKEKVETWAQSCTGGTWGKTVCINRALRNFWSLIL